MVPKLDVAAEGGTAPATPAPSSPLAQASATPLAQGSGTPIGSASTRTLKNGRTCTIKAQTAIAVANDEYATSASSSGGTDSPADETATPIPDPAIAASPTPASVISGSNTDTDAADLQAVVSSAIADSVPASDSNDTAAIDNSAFPGDASPSNSTASPSAGSGAAAPGPDSDSAANSAASANDTSAADSAAPAPDNSSEVSGGAGTPNVTPAATPDASSGGADALPVPADAPANTSGTSKADQTGTPGGSAQLAANVVDANNPTATSQTTSPTTPLSAHDADSISSSDNVSGSPSGGHTKHTSGHHTKGHSTKGHHTKGHHTKSNHIATSPSTGEAAQALATNQTTGFPSNNTAFAQILPGASNASRTSSAQSSAGSAGAAAGNLASPTVGLGPGNHTGGAGDENLAVIGNATLGEIPTIGQFIAAALATSPGTIGTATNGGVEALGGVVTNKSFSNTPIQATATGSGSSFVSNSISGVVYNSTTGLAANNISGAASISVSAVASPNASPISPTGSIAAYPMPKRGLCYNDPSYLEIFTEGDKIGWAQNWNQTSGSLPSGIKYYPELLGNKDGFLESWKANVETSGAQILFGFNEPEPSMCPPKALGSCLSADQAKTLWLQSMAPYHASGKRLVSPAVSRGDATQSGSGPNWLNGFLAECPDSTCFIDDIALHWYGTSDEIAGFKQYFTAAHTKYGKNIWITELGLTDTAQGGDYATFFKEVLPWLDQQDWIAGYAYMEAEILAPGKKISAVGQAYLSS
ncbi:MAG: hypothetical protein CYPHOPRED_004878 [Cyphobasidiales sp. Tagirdzhanova-0007]|nr:MAG: hypothetical protein CYPHOPRED_004878 [Cyphobasidiales sp. Tagirdzhanova-0007]